eukprot:gene27917-2523_t
MISWASCLDSAPFVADVQERDGKQQVLVPLQHSEEELNSSLVFRASIWGEAVPVEVVSNGKVSGFSCDLQVIIPEAVQQAFSAFLDGSPLEGCNLLHLAVKSGDLRTVQEVLSWAGLYPALHTPWSATDVSGMTPLHLDALLHKGHVARSLMMQGNAEDVRVAWDSVMVQHQHPLRGRQALWGASLQLQPEAPPMALSAPQGARSMAASAALPHPPVEHATMSTCLWGFPAPLEKEFARWRMSHSFQVLMLMLAVIASFPLLVEGISQW